MIKTFEYFLDISKFAPETLPTVDLAQVSIPSLELLKIHFIPVLMSEVAAMTSKVEAFPKASSATILVDVSMASVASTVLGRCVGGVKED
jgi:hypothetical protein